MRYSTFKRQLLVLNAAHAFNADNNICCSRASTYTTLGRLYAVFSV